MKIGVLALQGAFIEHINILRRLGVEAVEVRLPEELEGLDGLIIPGGESTTIGKLASLYGLIEPLRSFAGEKPVWGTCAGMIFMAKDVQREQPLLGLMDITVERNAFGRQVDSFEVGLDVPALPGDNGHRPPFPAIFIRGPRLAAADEEKGVDVLARLPHPYTRADGVAFVEIMAQRPDERPYAVTLNGQFIGIAGFSYAEGEPPELGYWLGEPYWGEGYMSEAVKGLVEAAFATRAYPRIKSRALAENTASLNVLEKAGFKRVREGLDTVGNAAGRPTVYLMLEQPKWM